MTDPLAELTDIALARFAIATNVIRETATALGMPATQIDDMIARSRTEFLAELAGTIRAVGQAADDPAAVRH